MAERIAELEQSDSLPTAVVNRAFRGERVDPLSLQRIARALGVAAHTLYLSSADLEPGTDAAEPAREHRIATAAAHPAAQTMRAAAGRSRWLWPLGAMLAMLSVPLIVHLLPPGPIGGNSQSAALSPGASTIVVPAAGPAGPALSASLAESLAAYWAVLPPPPLPGNEPQRLLRDEPVERVIEVDTRSAGRFIDVQLRLHVEGRMQVVWRGAHRATLAPRMTMARAAAELAHGAPVLPGMAVERYLGGREHLDRARTELNLRRALTDLASAVRLAPNFADAHAALCEALVLDSVRTGDASRLDEAATACARGRELAPGLLEVRRAQAYLDRKRGALEAAVTALSALTEEAPGDTDAWVGLAEAQLVRFSRGEDPAAARAALAAAEQAMALEPHFWKVPFTLARVHYFSGRLDDAVAASRAAAGADANMLTLSNLGSFQYCKGDFDAAAAAYERARELDPNGFVGDAQLGVIHYFRRDYAQALTSFEAALARLDEEGAGRDHRPWGNYAHTLRRLGRSSDAEAAYARAIALAQAAIDAGDKRALHEPYLAFYNEMLARLTGEQFRRWPAERLSALSDSQDPIALLYLAIVHGLRGDRATALSLRRRGAEGCPGFARAPDLELMAE